MSKEFERLAQRLDLWTIEQTAACFQCVGNAAILQRMGEGLMARDPMAS
jgi:hypothetical protein